LMYYIKFLIQLKKLIQFTKNWKKKKKKICTNYSLRFLRSSVSSKKSKKKEDSPLIHYVPWQASLTDFMEVLNWKMVL
jgi:hypothetical protein